ncbi:PP2C like phosphatase [Cryptosporidium sp. chipmunk genotype I]|uniref:PP2C like phosphatase n=1 Tax=Cryptosporidium sp. chipmunk genotype I TaxID=1280935 RepID=UPI00351A0BD2|nr:PP2C like phosphatase [Cryptosporidium sp. chipmunk genotype I]
MNWLVDWGVSCSQGGCKENQDGWFVSIPAQKKSDKKENQKRRQINNSKYDYHKVGRLDKLGFSQGVWNFDPIEPNLTNAGIFSPQRISGFNRNMQCLDEVINEAFPPVFPLFTLPPLPPKRSAPGWNSHSTGNKLEGFNRSCFFGLLDGHGHYGKTASHVAGYCMSQVLSKEVPDLPNNLDIGDYVEQVLYILNRGFSHAHDSVISANVSSKKDFGTTCIVVGIVGQYLVTANCGDSSAICIIPNLDRNTKFQLKPGEKPAAFNSGNYNSGGIGNNQSASKVSNNNTGGGNMSCTSSSISISGDKNSYNGHAEESKYRDSKMSLPDLPAPLSYSKPSNQATLNFHGIYYLSNPHCLNRKSERQRIDQSGVGKVVLGDYGMLRLIPSYLSYSQARDLGLSISMSRSLGHMHLSRCALLPTPDYRILNLGGNPPRRECIKSIRKRSIDSQRAKIEDEKMACFSEALIEQSVIAIGWGNRPSIYQNDDQVEKVELDWNTDDDSFSNHLAINGTTIKPWRESYIVIMSDGVSDILDAFTIADIIVDSQDKSMQEIAGLLTSEAERKRRMSNIRADNCTVIVVHLTNKLYDQTVVYNEALESPTKPCIEVNLSNSICLEKNSLKNQKIKANTNTITSTIHTCATSDTSNFSNANSVLSSPTKINTCKSFETPIRSFKPNQMYFHRTVTPIQRRRKITTPSPAKAKTCKIRELPNILLKNQN